MTTLSLTASSRPPASGSPAVIETGRAVAAAPPPTSGGSGGPARGAGGSPVVAFEAIGEQQRNIHTRAARAATLEPPGRNRRAATRRKAVPGVDRVGHRHQLGRLGVVLELGDRD